MDDKEKELYSLIFTLTLKLAKNYKFATFAKGMMAMCEEWEIRNDNSFSFSWELLKKYADIKPEDESRWVELVNSVDDYANKHNDPMTRRMLYLVVKEIERRSVKQ